MTTRPSDEWRPTAAQERALRSATYELLYGGAAGGGKTDYLLASPLRWVGHPGSRALLLRRSFPELEKTLIARSREIYPRLGARYHEQRHEWTFPGGGKLSFGYCERDADVLRYQGAEYSFIGFDELTHFSEYIYRYLSSRARSSQGLPIRIRATSNPGGPGHEWVRARWGAWLGDTAHPPEARASAGATLWYDAEGRECHGEHEGALSRTFVAAVLADNPYLPSEYRAQLQALDPVTRRQLLEGDWDARPARGVYFPPSAWRVVERVEESTMQQVRAWDFGATREGDPTAGVLMGRDRGGGYAVLHVELLRGGPSEVRARVLSIAETDGPSVAITVPQDPGQAGVDQAQSYVRMLAGYRVRTRRPTGDKITRAAPFSSQVAGGNVRLLRGPWTRAFVDELAGFPEWEHDDQVDAASDAFAELAGVSPVGDTGIFEMFASAGIVRRDHYVAPHGLAMPEEDDEPLGFGRGDR